MRRGRLQDVLGNPISIDDSAETLSRVLDAKASVVKGEKPQLQVTPAPHLKFCVRPGGSDALQSAARMGTIGPWHALVLLQSTAEHRAFQLASWYARTSVYPDVSKRSEPPQNVNRWNPPSNSLEPSAERRTCDSGKAGGYPREEHCGQHALGTAERARLIAPGF